MAGAQHHGLAGLVDLLSDEVLRRGTGALDIAGRGAVYVVFGHPLHAVLGDDTGLAAIDRIAALLRDQTDVEVTWLPGLTAGKAHSLSPSDGVLERLRGDKSDHFGPGSADQGGAADIVGDLDLRRRISAKAEPGAPVAPIPDPRWAEVVDQVCVAIEGTLHLHARALTEVIRGAPADPGAILTAIERARSVSIRAVSRPIVAALLTDAEALVKERTRSA